MSSSKSGAKGGGKFTHKLYFDPRADQSDTGGYWITDDQLRQKLANLINTEERIQKVSVYSNPLSSWQATNGLLYHAFIVMETNDWWWSIEKNTEDITIQRSKNLESVRDMYQRTKRTTGWTSSTKIRENETTVGGNTTIKELINYIWRKDCLNNVYHLLDENCKKFAAMVFDRIKSPNNDQVYFDEAADQPRSTTSSCYMSVDKVFSEVQRLSASETFTQLEIYKVPLSSWKIPDFYVPGFLAFLFIQISEFFSHHYFGIFETDEGTYWSFERLPTRFTIQRARNKDILLKECQRNSRDTLLSKTKLVKSDVAVRQNMNAVLDFIWKKDNMDIFYMPAELCGLIALQIYDQLKRKNVFLSSTTNTNAIKFALSQKFFSNN
ncbi:uncharacterized protein LOC123471475 [Daphnia magna]|uniref:uncharacterized protein LOC123471475 n=1 Tax=Daphnia magna TaxID=35525 RepID=UPI001E1BD893|nr:uncharacterized protein LOC123471475 [Daphnia magna]